MRTALADHLNQTLRVRGFFGGYRRTKAARRVAVVFDLCHADTADYLAEHLWINHSSAMKGANPQPGDTIVFTGVVDWYRKGRSDQDFAMIRIRDFTIERRAFNREKAVWRERLREG